MPGHRLRRRGVDGGEGGGYSSSHARYPPGLTGIGDSSTKYFAISGYKMQPPLEWIGGLSIPGFLGLLPPKAPIASFRGPHPDVETIPAVVVTAAFPQYLSSSRGQRPKNDRNRSCNCHYLEQPILRCIVSEPIIQLPFWFSEYELRS